MSRLVLKLNQKSGWILAGTGINSVMECNWLNSEINSAQLTLRLMRGIIIIELKKRVVAQFGQSARFIIAR